jgi:hypothetical protein
MITNDFNIKISLKKPIKGGNLMFIILKIKIKKKNKKEIDINFTTNNERVFHHANNPTNQNIKGERNP